MSSENEEKRFENTSTEITYGSLREFFLLMALAAGDYLTNSEYTGCLVGVFALLTLINFIYTAKQISVQDNNQA